jgi:D-arabinose 1-dehydrogenase-like Zn-dependent alcohol dehydrogenase
MASPDGGADKGEMCKRIGAEHFVDFTQTSDINAEVIRLADGEGVHGLIVTASVSPPELLIDNPETTSPELSLVFPIRC